MFSKVMSNLGASFRAPPPLLVAHRCSCCGKSPGGNRPDIHTCSRHECWHTPRVGNAHLWRTHPHLQELRKFLASLGLLNPWQPNLERLALGSPAAVPCRALPTQDPLTLSKPGGQGPFGPLTWLEFPVEKEGIRAGTDWQSDNQAILKKDEMVVKCGLNYRVSLAAQ